MNTQKKLSYIKEMLVDGIIFEIYHLAHNEETVYGVTTFKYDHKNLALFPYTRYPGGCGMGGSYTTLDDSAKKILLLIRDNHSYCISDIYDYIKQKVPFNRRMGHIVTLKWDLDVSQVDIWDGTIFCDDPEEMLMINEELEKKRKKIKPLKAQLYEILKTDIENYKQIRKEKGDYDENI